MGGGEGVKGGATKVGPMRRGGRRVGGGGGGGGGGGRRGGGDDGVVGGELGGEVDNEGSVGRDVFGCSGEAAHVKT